MVISTSFRNCGNLISYISLVFGKVTFLLKKLLKLSKTATHMYVDTNNKILGCRDPRCKHEYIYLIERYPDDDGGEESDKHI